MSRFFSPFFATTVEDNEWSEERREEKIYERRWNGIENDDAEKMRWNRKWELLRKLSYEINVIDAIINL